MHPLSSLRLAPDFRFVTIAFSLVFFEDIRGCVGKVGSVRAKAEEQISAFLANKPGVVADLCAALNEHRVNILGMTVLDTVDIGTMRMIVDNVEEAKRALKEAGAAFVVVPVVAIALTNKAGAFARVARAMANAGINIEYFYATAAPGTSTSLAIFRVGDIDRALEIDFTE